MTGPWKVGAVAAALLPLGCRAHWRLTKPVPRSGGAYENNPLASNMQESWVCRNAAPNSRVPRPTLTAGSSTEITYGDPAATFGHAGDCAVYISYDNDRPRRTMRWVKIANLPDCRAQINQPVPIQLPGQLPAGDAVLRWEQYALHMLPGQIEWYVQCADVKISSSSTRSWESFNSFSMIDNGGRPAHPSSPGSYRSSGANLGSAGFFMVGPACVDDAINQCELTAAGTDGNTGFGGGDAAGGSPAAAPAAAPSPAPTLAPSPAPGPSCVPIGDCSAYAAWCDQAAYAEFCAAQGNSCPRPFCRTAASTAAPTAAPAAVPTVPFAPTAAPTPASSGSSGGGCVPETDCSINTLCTVMDWTAHCSALALANLCDGPYCKLGASLLSSPAAKASGAAAQKHGALVVDEPGRGLRAPPARRSRAAAQVALIQRNSVAAWRVDLPAEGGEGEGGAGRGRPASGLSEPAAEL